MFPNICRVFLGGYFVFLGDTLYMVRDMPLYLEPLYTPILDHIHIQGVREKPPLFNKRIFSSLNIFSFVSHQLICARSGGNNGDYKCIPRAKKSFLLKRGIFSRAVFWGVFSGTPCIFDEIGYRFCGICLFYLCRSLSTFVKFGEFSLPSTFRRR